MCEIEIEKAIGNIGKRTDDGTRKAYENGGDP